MLAFLPLVAAIYGPAARKEGVVVATASSFDEEVLKHDGPVAVQFYAPWCGHCKALKPAWKKATKALSPGTIKLVVVDATTEGALARKYGVKGYPSIQIFGSNKRKPETYQGARDESSLISGLRKMAKSGGGGGGGSGGSGGDKSKPKPKRASSSGGGGGGHSGWGAGSAVEELGDSDFESRVMEGEGLWLVAFYAPWCGHCRNLEPEWKAAAARLEGSGFKLGAVDATQATGVASEHGVQGYPTIKFFNRGAATPYEGGRTAEDIVGHAMSALETSGVEAEVPQLTSAEQWRSLCGKKGTLCAVAFLPHILDSGADGRNAHIATLKAIARRNRRLYTFLWSEGGAQPALEEALDRCCASYPALAAVSLEKGRFALMRDAFDEKHAATFVGGVLRGGIRTEPVAASALKVVSVEEWDGKDGELPEEEPLDYDDDDGTQEGKSEL